MKKAAKGPAAKPGKLRIIAGIWRGRTIETPADNAVRPTADRVREALFNRLVHGFEDFRIPDARVADVFAGTGALGLEAVSRGAGHAIFLERDPAVVALIKRNIAKLGAEDKTTVMNADGANLPKAAGPCDLALLDPPYGEGLVEPALASLARQGWLKPRALISVETGAEEPEAGVAGFALLHRQAYGRAVLSIYRYIPSAAG